MQIILFLIFYIIYKISILSILDYQIFIKYNFYIILFNLLPIYPLDGSKIIISLLELKVSFNLSLILSYIISFIFILLFIIFNYIYHFDNYLIILFLLYKVIMYIKEYKYILNKFYLERLLSSKQYKKINYTNTLKGIKKNHYNFINNISEKKVLSKRLS